MELRALSKAGTTLPTEVYFNFQNLLSMCTNKISLQFLFYFWGSTTFLLYDTFTQHFLRPNILPLAFSALLIMPALSHKYVSSLFVFPIPLILLAWIATLVFSTARISSFVKSIWKEQFCKLLLGTVMKHQVCWFMFMKEIPKCEKRHGNR